ncbi:MAG: hypothetical protein Q8K18_01015 [Burkholderiales bacterium]|nr:hypothetical protein [Burkholderiales bacterium]
MASPAAHAQAPQAAAPPAPAAAPTPAEIKLGQDLFDGRARFANKAASCKACHHVHHDAIVGGGSLSTDVTQSFSRMGKDGLTAILGNAPFPVMQAAYAGKELAPDEIQALVAFLQHADQQSQTSMRQPLDVGLKMFGAGAAGVAGLMGFFTLIGRRRKQQSVNQEIYDRQIKSE